MKFSRAVKLLKGVCNQDYRQQGGFTGPPLEGFLADKRMTLCWPLVYGDHTRCWAGAYAKSMAAAHDVGQPSNWRRHDVGQTLLRESTAPKHDVGQPSMKHSGCPNTMLDNRPRPASRPTQRPPNQTNPGQQLNCYTLLLKEELWLQ